MKRLASITLAALSLVSLLATAAVADAPETGVVNGVVTDAGGSPLPGVAVMLTGERGEKATVTGDDGRYQFVLVQPGAYKVSAMLEGMGTAEGTATANAGGRETVDLELKLETAEEITVTSEAPMVDKFNVTAGTTVQAEIGTQTAGTTRSFYGLLSALPGVASDAENADIQGTRPSVNGSHFADQYVFVDGVDATWGKYGGSRLFIPTTSVTEVAMEAGGSSPSTAARSDPAPTSSSSPAPTTSTAPRWCSARKWTGAPTTRSSRSSRSGSSFRSRATGSSSTSSRRAPNRPDTRRRSAGRSSRTRRGSSSRWSDFDDNATEKLLGGDPQDASFQMESQVAKLNFQPSAAHTVTASYMDTPSKRVYSHPPSFDYWTPTPHDISSDLASLTWNWSISSNLFLEAKLAAQESTEHKLLNCGSVDVATCLAEKQQDRGPDGVGDLRFPANPAAGPHWPGNNYGVYLDQGFVGAWHNGWILDDGFGNNVFPRDQANASFTQFAGAGHEIKYGLDYQDTKWEGEQSRTSLYSGIDFDALNPYGYKDAGITATACSFALGRSCLFRDYNAEFLTSDRGSGDSEVENLAAFVRDRFTVGDHWTFNLGFRAETQEGLNDVRRTVFEDDYVSPRASASYDVHGNGAMLFSANVGRYHALLNQAWIYQRLDDKWQGTRGFRDWLFCSPTDIALGNGSQFNSPLFSQCREKGIGYNVLFRDFADVTIWELVDQGYFDSNITPYYKDEAILGFEWQFAGNWALDAKAIYWELGDMIGSTVQLGPRGEQFELAANYKDYPEIIAKLEAARRANGLPQAVSQQTLDNFEEGARSTRRCSSRSTAASRVVGRSTTTSPGRRPRPPAPEPGGTTPTASTAKSCTYADAGHDHRLPEPTGGALASGGLRGQAHPLPRHAGVDHQPPRQGQQHGPADHLQLVRLQTLRPGQSRRHRGRPLLVPERPAVGARGERADPAHRRDRRQRRQRLGAADDRSVRGRRPAHARHLHAQPQHGVGVPSGLQGPARRAARRVGQRHQPAGAATARVRQVVGEAGRGRTGRRLSDAARVPAATAGEGEFDGPVLGRVIATRPAGVDMLC